MIAKFLKVISVGRFKAYTQPAGDLTFRRLTIIFGENGLGKSTLSTILRSLKINSPDLLVERKTIGTSEPQSVDIRTSADNRLFDGTHWNDPMPELEIFDAAFVSENVYSGDSVSHDHKKGLLKFAIGQGAVNIAMKVSEQDQLSRKLSRKLQDAEKRLVAQIGTGMTLESFLALAVPDDLQIKLSEAERLVASLQNLDNLRSNSELQSLSLALPPYEAALEKCSVTIQDLSKETVDKVQNHVRAHLDAEGEVWLDTGTDYQKDDSCPYCGQSIQDSSVAKLFPAYFSREYKNLQSDLGTLVSKLDRDVSEDIQGTLELTTKANKGIKTVWIDRLDMQFPELGTESFSQVVEGARKTLFSLVRRKRANPLEKAVPTTEENETIQKLTSCAQDLEAYNLEITKTKSFIETELASLESGDLPKATSDLADLKLRKLKSESGMEGLISEHERLKMEKEACEKEKDKLQGELDLATSTFISKYQENINSFLESFGAAFRIQDARKTSPGGTPGLGYRLQLRNTPIELEPRGAQGPVPSFKTILSSGDRNTLAFAFFLAKVALDGHQASRIVVFDDPVTSLDASRKNHTQQEIRRVSASAAQVIVFSHDTQFLRHLFDGANEDGIDTKALCVRPVGEDSTIDEWPIIEETRTPFEKDYFALAEFAEHRTGVPEEVYRRLRPALEHHLRNKFPKQFSSLALGGMVDLVSNAQSSDILWGLKQRCEEDLKKLNEFSRSAHHGEKTSASPRRELDSGELHTYVENALKIIHN